MLLRSRFKSGFIKIYYLNVIRPQFSIALNPKSGTATMSIFGMVNRTPKYSSKNGKIAVVIL